MRPDQAQLERILGAGIKAPSAENQHHLQFGIDAEAVELIATDASSWPSLPHRRMLALLAHGAVLENIALASLSQRLSLRLVLFPDPARPELVARMTWQAALQDPDPLVDAIEQRHTNRRFFTPKRPAASALRELQTAAAAVDGAELKWLDEPALRRGALAAIRLAESERFRRRSLHAELFDAVRFEIGWRKTADERLAPAALEVEAPVRPVFAQLRRWWLMRALSLLGVHLVLGLRAGYLPARTAPSIGLLLARHPDPRSAELLAGRALQRTWLAATAHGLAFQPMAAATVLAAQTPGGGWVSEGVKRSLRTRLAGLGTAAEGASPAMLFRLGFAAAPTVRAARRPLADYLTARAVPQVIGAAASRHDVT